MKALARWLKGQLRPQSASLPVAAKAHSEEDSSEGVWSHLGRRVMHALDADGDGSLDFEEFRDWSVGD